MNLMGIGTNPQFPISNAIIPSPDAVVKALLGNYFSKLLCKKILK